MKLLKRLLNAVPIAEAITLVETWLEASVLLVGVVNQLLFRLQLLGMELNTGHLWSNFRYYFPTVYRFEQVVQLIRTK